MGIPAPFPVCQFVSQGYIRRYETQRCYGQGSAGYSHLSFELLHAWVTAAQKLDRCYDRICSVADYAGSWTYMKPKGYRRIWVLATIVSLQPVLQVPAADTRDHKVPILVESDIILVQVKVEPADKTLTFVLDTGAELTTLDEKVASSLHLPKGKEIDVLAVGGEHAVPTVQFESIQLGALRFPSLTAAVYDLAHLTASLESEVDGVLGIDVLSHFAFTVDYTRRELVIWKFKIPERFRKSRVPLRKDKGGYSVPIRLNGTVDANLLLDTGTNMTQLPSNVWQPLLKAWKPQKLLKGINSSGQEEARSYLVRLQSLAIGNYTIPGQVVRLIPPVNSGTFSEQDAPGLLASDILRHYVFTVDIPHEQLFLTPDPNYHSDPHEFTTIGIQFAKVGKAVYVTSVWEGSPAQKATIRRGDEILEVQGRTAYDLSSDELQRILHGRTDSLVSLKLRRGSQVLHLKVPRQKLL